MDIELKKYRIKRRNEIKDKAINLLKQGLSYREIGKVLGISYETVRTFWGEYKQEKKQGVDKSI